MEEGQAAVLAGELVGAVDAAVAGGAERGLVGAAEHGGRLEAAHVALHAHGDRLSWKQVDRNRILVCWIEGRESHHP